MGPVNDFLVTYLDSIDESLLEYLDEDDELKLDAIQRIRFYTTALLDGSITPDRVLEDWPDWYQLVPAPLSPHMAPRSYRSWKAGRSSSEWSRSRTT